MSGHENLQHAVADAMAAILAGDRATWELHRLAAPSLRRILRSEAYRVGAWISEDDLYDLTLDGAMELAELARSWKPGSALPWVWARPRITALVHRHLGTFTRELDDSCLEIEEPLVVIPVDEPRQVLRSLAARHAGAERLDRRLAAVTDRDAEIWLRFQMERAAGNRSPAVTVAADHAMRPAAVRKVVQRVGERLGPDVAAAA